MVWDAPVAIAQPWSGRERIGNARLIAAAPKLYATLAEIAWARWPSVNGDDPVKRIQDFARQILAASGIETEGGNEVPSRSDESPAPKGDAHA